MTKRKTTNYSVTTNRVVDLQTGEVSEVETVKRQKISVESEQFYMVFIDYIAPLFELKNGTSKSILSFLCLNAKFNTGEVDLSPAKRAEVCKILNISKSTLTVCLKELASKNLIKGSKGSYKINPQVFWKGDLLARQAILDTKEFQITFTINTESADLKVLDETA